MANKMSDIAAMLIGVSSDYLGNGVNLETLRMNVNFALGSIDRELESEKQAIESVSESQKPSTSESKLPVGSVVESCDHPTGTNKKGMVYVCDNCIDKFNFG